MDGSAEFNEVFFTDVRCPKDNVIGGVNNGWKVAMTTLGFERGTSATTCLPPVPEGVRRHPPSGPASGADADPLIRQRLARSWSDIKIMEINGFRTFTDALAAPTRPRPSSACNKMFWSEAHQATLLFAMDILGMGGQTLLGAVDDAGFGGPASPVSTPSTPCRRSSSSPDPRRSGADGGDPRNIVSTRAGDAQGAQAEVEQDGR